MHAQSVLLRGDVGIAGVTTTERPPADGALLDAYSESVAPKEMPGAETE